MTENNIELNKPTTLLTFPYCIAWKFIFPHILMASKLSFRTLVVHRRKPEKDNNNTNDLAFVKAAAWAWYQHNSGSKGKTLTEFDAIISRREARPSRYKLEAVRMGKEAREGSHVHARKLSLLDEYEVQSISRQLNCLVESSSSSSSSSSHNNHNHKKLVTAGSNSMQKKKVKKGFWLRHGIVCGREEDVVGPSLATRLPPK
ncbi:hypothetical protein VNO78_31453 [Psophocarpus tetragonolobus]|uniref:Uncharacterized protein n=1 Tax=Psophocarpus tetragonolobus TaxID=3891 RepID=A0AAN9RYK1_PSOTE